LLEIVAPARLHFGLLAHSARSPRQFGGAGLMVDEPATVARFEPASEVDVTGVDRARAEGFVRRGLARSVEAGWIEPGAGLRVRVTSAPRPHAGLGTGTSLGMTIAMGAAEVLGLPASERTASRLANLAGRGERSAIGAWGFVEGGMIVEGGKSSPEEISPRLMRLRFPPHWRVVAVSPTQLQGLFGRSERRAFATMPEIPRETTAEMCRLVLLGLAPTLAEADLDGFGEALFELQQTVGRCFASSQGGVYAHPRLEAMVEAIQAAGVRGVGQSSWGPTLYAVTTADDAPSLASELRDRFELADDEVWVTGSANRGARILAVDPSISATPNR